MESYSDDNAKKFAQFVAKSHVYTEHKLKFTIRGWLGPLFKDMAEKQLLVDKAGQKIEKFGFYFNKNPVVLQKDKAIVAKMFVNMKDVDAVIKHVSGYERAPMCTFFDPQKMKDNRQQKKTFR